MTALDVNITRVSYNKAVDSHTIFIEAEGSRQQLAQADEQLAAIGYLRSGGAEKSVVLLEFQLRDVPGGVTDILACIERFGFNISSSAANRRLAERKAPMWLGTVVT